MTEKPKRRPRDVSLLARKIVQEATEPKDKEEEDAESRKEASGGSDSS